MDSGELIRFCMPTSGGGTSIDWCEPSRFRARPLAAVMHCALSAAAGTAVAYDSSESATRQRKAATNLILTTAASARDGKAVGRAAWRLLCYARHAANSNVVTLTVLAIAGWNCTSRCRACFLGL